VEAASPTLSEVGGGWGELVSLAVHAARGTIAERAKTKTPVVTSLDLLRISLHRLLQFDDQTRPPTHNRENPPTENIPLLNEEQ
jgi:hypothetical protein